MTRLHKIIERLLKAYPQVRTVVDETLGGLPGSGVSEAFFGWAQAVAAMVWEDPVLDIIAANYGLTGEELEDFLNRIRIIFRLRDDKMAEAMIDGQWLMPAVDIFVSNQAFRADMKEEAAQILLHEVVHALDEQAGTKDAPGEYRNWEFWNIPDEIEAIKAEMVQLINSGYTDEEIIALLLEIRTPKNTVGMPYQAEAYVEAITAMLQEVHLEEEPLLERT